MPMSPEYERLRKAAGSEATEEAGVLADAAAELEATAATVTAYAAFSRTAGIDPAKVVSAPEATAQAFGRELADLKAAASALPKPLDPETASDRRRVLSREINRLNTPTDKRGAFGRDFIDKLADILSGSATKPNVAMLSRDDGEDDFRAMKIVELLDKAGPPPTGSFAGGREAPRQAPAGGQSQKTPEEVQAEVDANLAQTELGRRALAARRAETAKA